MITSKEGDKYFVENFGKDTGDVSFVPSVVTTALEDLKAAISRPVEEDHSAMYIKVLIGETIESYKSIFEKNGSKTLSRDMSCIVIGNSYIFDNEMCNFFTKDVPTTIKDGKSSRFTYLVTECLKDKDTLDNTVAELTSLINTVIEYFDPQVVAKVLKSVIEANKKSEYFTDSRIRGYFESLVMREKVIYGNEINFVDDLVWFNYINIIDPSPIDILEDKYKLYWAEENGVKEYSKLKQFCTKIVINGVLSSRVDPKDAFEVLRYIRNDVEDWHKHKDLSTRPENPSSFEQIDITQFVSVLYSNGMHVIGNTKQIVDKFDGIIEDQKKNLGTAKTEEEKEDTKKYIKEIEDRKTEYLTFKSLIAFLLQELTVNEKIAYKVFTPELVVDILVREPPKDFGLNDSNSCIGSLFTKRDFNPVGSTPINPYYIHYGHGDLSTPEAEFIATALSAHVHPGMKSIVALSGSYNFENLETTINSIKDAVIRAKDIAYSTITSWVNRVSSKNEKDRTEIENTICGFKFDDVETLAAKSKELADKVKDAGNNNPELIDCGLLRILVEIETTSKWYCEYINSAKNIISQVEYVISNFTDPATISSARASINENKPLKNFWPITQQYEYEISEDPASNIVGEKPLEPGDIEHHRYGSRYTIQHPCD